MVVDGEVVMRLLLGRHVVVDGVYGEVAIPLLLRGHVGVEGEFLDPHARSLLLIIDGYSRGLMHSGCGWERTGNWGNVLDAEWEEQAHP